MNKVSCTKVFPHEIIANSFHRILALYSHVCMSVCDQAWHFHLSPPYDVLDHTNHIFSESLSSGDDNDRDEYLQKDKDTHTQTKTNTKCFQDPMYTIFFKIRGFKDKRYYIGCLLFFDKDKDMVDIDIDEYLQKDKYKDKDTQTQTKTNTKCFQDPISICYIFRKQGVQGFTILYWLSSCDNTDKDKNSILCIIRGEYFSGVNIFQG